MVVLRLWSGCTVGLGDVCFSTETPASSPGTARYRDEPGTDPNSRGILRAGLPGPLKSRVPGNRYTTPPYSQNTHHDAPISTLLCTTHGAEQAQRGEGGPDCHPARGSRRVFDDFQPPTKMADLLSLLG